MRISNQQTLRCHKGPQNEQGEEVTEAASQMQSGPGIEGQCQRKYITIIW